MLTITFIPMECQWSECTTVMLLVHSILNRFLLKTSFHALLTFIYFCYLFESLAFVSAASSVSWYWSCLVCSGRAYEIFSGGGPSTYVYCVVCYRVTVAPYIRSVGHVCAYFYTLDDDLEGSKPVLHPRYAFRSQFSYFTTIFFNSQLTFSVVRSATIVRLTSSCSSCSRR